MLSFLDIYRLLTTPSPPSLSTSDFHALVHPHTPRCTIRNTLHAPTSAARDFDLTQCAEYAWALPVPLVVCALGGVWQLVQVARGKWGAPMERNGKSRRKMWAKVVSERGLVGGGDRGGSRRCCFGADMP